VAGVQFDRGRRLCVLFEAGAARYSIEATSVLEIGAAPSDTDTLHGVQPLQDLSTLLGGEPEQRPGMSLLLDVSPTLAIRIKRVVDVADIARAPFFLLPPGLGDSLALMIRGATLHGGHLYLELAADMLSAQPLDPRVIPQGRLYYSSQPPERALVFESEGKAYGISLPFVSQILVLGEEFCTLPFSRAPLVGLLPHAQSLWPVYSMAGMAGEASSLEGLIILADVAGRNLGICAARALGVRSHFRPTDNLGEFASEEVETCISILDLERMFS